MRYLSLRLGRSVLASNKFKLRPLLGQRPRTLVAACGLLVALTALPTHAQTCAPPPSGMVSWWTLDQLDPATGKYADLAGGNNHGTPIGNPVQIPGQYVGNSLQPGTGTYVQASPATNLNFGTGAFTIDAWVKAGQANQIEPIAAKWTSNSGYFLFLQLGKLYFQSGSLVLAGPPVTPMQWNFVAAVVNPPNVTLYVGASPSGNLSQVSHTAAVNATNSQPFNIGLSPFNPHPNGIVIDELEIFKRALTQPELQSIVKAGSAGKCKGSTKGMTWIHTASNAQTGTITVGCGSSGPNPCDPAHGDTVCTQPLPLLCIYKPTPPFQLPKTGVNNADQYYLWSGGVVATTPPVAGNAFSNLSASSTPAQNANQYCIDQFGSGWRVAEFHDGWGWNFQAYGGTVSAPTVPSTRFWVHINDQPAANCWATP